MSRRYLKRRLLVNLEARRVPETVSQLTGGREANAFFGPSTSTGSNQPTTPLTTSNQLPPTGSNNIFTPPPSTSLTTPASSNVSATQTTNSTPTQNPSPLQKTPLPSKINTNSTLTNSSLSSLESISDPSPSSTQKLAVAVEASSSNAPNRELASTMMNNTIPPNLIEAICVVAAALALIIGGSLYYWFRSKKKKARIATPEESKSNPTSSRDHMSRSGSMSSIKRPINWPIDKKTIRLKKKTESIISFGPGPEPEISRYQVYDHATLKN